MQKPMIFVESVNTLSLPGKLKQIYFLTGIFLSTMRTQGLNDLKANRVVDARGTACPGPLLEVKKSIGKVEGGQIIEILTSDDRTKRDIPKWCRKNGHDYLGTIDEPGYFRLFLKK